MEDEPVRIPITDVFDLHSVPDSDVRAIIEEYLIEARNRGFRNLRVIHGEERDPHLPLTAVDAVLISNTYHELTAPRAIVELLRQRLKAGGRLVIVDRAPRGGDNDLRHDAGGHHELMPDGVENDLREAGFVILRRDDRFIDRVGDDDLWWLLVAQKP